MAELVPDIFISYSSKDRVWVSSLVKALEACGFSVWWDKALFAGDNFYSEIETVLDKAGCVITVWSESATKSEWVLAESKRGMTRNVWMPVMYQPARIPLAFETRHSANLQAWQGSIDEACFQSLLRAIEKVLKCPVTNTECLSGHIFSSKKRAFLGYRNTRKYLLIVAILICATVSVVIGTSSQLSLTPKGNIGDCSGTFGDITGSNISLDCSKGK